ncbi:MAG: ABC transporter ATP-binding protein [Planctomycetota bacterium]|jgi:peptide/nickel transport system ATP-binding protein|nr:ABC transporter ATP-binding protein [Planctomycetota bacterium]MDA1201539.1 ABC transporter ATP-binding protein [Planctomycetota bacterium]
MPLLEIRNLVTAFHTPAGRVPAVDGVSLSIERGTTLGLVGESGCGKSVTAMSVLGLVASPGRIEAGQILLDRDGRSIDLVGLPERQLRTIRGGRIGMIFQEPMTSLNPVFTVGNQVAEAVRLHQKVSRQAARARALELLRLVRIADPERRLDEYPHQLSGGMRQRVVIAMALACEPDLLIADEPTTALDVTIQAQVLELLADLRQRLGMAILLITHDLGVVAETCDEVAVMYAGRIVERAAAAALFARPLHPYTIGLLAARPEHRRAAADPLAAIPGMVPQPRDFPAGCRFHPRCPFVREPRCTAELPSLRELEPGHLVRCHYAGDLGDPATVPAEARAE